MEKSSGIIHPKHATLVLTGDKSCNFLVVIFFCEDLGDINFFGNINGLRKIIGMLSFNMFFVFFFHLGCSDSLLWFNTRQKTKCCKLLAHSLPMLLVGW